MLPPTHREKRNIARGGGGDLRTRRREAAGQHFVRFAVISFINSNLVLFDDKVPVKEEEEKRERTREIDKGSRARLFGSISIIYP